MCYPIRFVDGPTLLGGLGGGIGTIHEQECCREGTSFCLNSVKVKYVYIFSLGLALVLTLPVILYPITEMLEAAANNILNPETMTTLLK
jgi:hypothetical protein